MYVYKEYSRVYVYKDNDGEGIPLIFLKDIILFKMIKKLTTLPI